MGNEAKIACSIAKLENYIIKGEESLEKGSAKLHNKYNNPIESLLGELYQDTENREWVFDTLLKHENLYVQSRAARYAVRADYLKSEALNILNMISKNKECTMARVNASVFLKYGNIDSKGNPSAYFCDSERNEQTEDEMENINNHVEKHIGDINVVLHEVVSDELHIDILHISPSVKRNYHTFVTNGMSRFPMHIPEGNDAYSFCELMITLPPDWPTSEDDLKKENNYWPIKTLKQIACLPHGQNTWLAYGHTIQNETKQKAYAANTDFGCMLLAYPISVKNAGNFVKLTINHKTIVFYCLIPIYDEELKFKMEKNADALLDKLDSYRINDVVAANRINVCK